MAIQNPEEAVEIFTQLLNLNIRFHNKDAYEE